MYKLKFDKETDRFYRYSEYVDDVKFEIYIEKWRTPSPKPSNIIVEVGIPNDFEEKTKYKQEDISNNPSNKNNPIYEELREIEEMTKTIRHDPIVTRNDWEVGSVYIPKDIIPNSEIVSIFIQWQ
ncbi:MAG: hypothetical protein ACFFDN_50970 [Candidatus Hodarchaeota archaeon]